MFKFSLLLSFICLSSSISCANVVPPQWNEICPPGLETAEYKEIRWFWPESTKATQEIYNYWAKRRADFENSLAECDFMYSNFKAACYENLKSKHHIDNELYNNSIQNKMITNQIWRDTQRMSNPIMINILTR